MKIIRRIFEYAYLLIALVLFEGVYATWNEDRNNAYMLLAFAFAAIGMYVFKKIMRNRASK
ncbi:MAG: hypothetical protein COB60_04330 [Flavobacteriaceae bacterium]|nr:MAG: hypothetical protein COB60_04330 [Flavobacteriaceae bacterium]